MSEPLNLDYTVGLLHKVWLTTDGLLDDIDAYLKQVTANDCFLYYYQIDGVHATLFLFQFEEDLVNACQNCPLHKMASCLGLEEVSQVTVTLYTLVEAMLEGWTELDLLRAGGGLRYVDPEDVRVD